MAQIGEVTVKVKVVGIGRVKKVIRKLEKSAYKLYPLNENGKIPLWVIAERSGRKSCHDPR